MLKILLLTCLLFQKLEFNYTGKYQVVELFPGVYTFHCYGAQGGGAYTNGKLNTSLGGRGAYTKGGILLQGKSYKFYIFIGGQGVPNSIEFGNQTGPNKGGFNGGGYSGKDNGNSSDDASGGGGGATDIRIDSMKRSSIIMAAAGGSGAVATCRGAPGGTLRGREATCAKYGFLECKNVIYVDSDRTNQTSGGLNGKGENGIDDSGFPGSGGGGGWMGGVATGNGYGKYYFEGVASSGSSYIAGYKGCVKNKYINFIDSMAMQSDVQEGDGRVVIEINYECPENCIQCKSSITCIKCKDGTYSANNICYSDCSKLNDPTNNLYFGADLAQMTCKQCMANCIDCTNNHSTCNKCQNGYFYNKVANICELIPTTQFSQSGKFTFSDFLTFSNQFSMSYDFTTSSDFSNSQCFTKSNNFIESFKFSSSFLFTKSSDFTVTSKFSSSSLFTKSNHFSKSSIFSNSIDFTKLLEFTKSFYTNDESTFSSFEYYSFIDNDSSNEKEQLFSSRFEVEQSTEIYSSIKEQTFSALSSSFIESSISDDEFSKEKETQLIVSLTIENDSTIENCPSKEESSPIISSEYGDYSSANDILSQEEESLKESYSQIDNEKSIQIESPKEEEKSSLTEIDSTYEHRSFIEKDSSNEKESFSTILSQDNDYLQTENDFTNKNEISSMISSTFKDDSSDKIDFPLNTNSHSFLISSSTNGNPFSITETMHLVFSKNFFNETHSMPSKRISKTIIIIIVVCVLVLLILISIFIFILTHKKKQSETQNDDNSHYSNELTTTKLDNKISNERTFTIQNDDDQDLNFWL